MELNAGNAPPGLSASRQHELQNSFGPETTPYEHVHQQPLESCGSRPNMSEQGLEKAPDGAPAVSAPVPREPKRRILGMPAAVFWTVAALLLLVVLGVGIGVGVALGTRHGGGGSGSSPGASPPDGRNDTEPSKSTSATTQTSTAPAATVTAGTHGMASNSCNFPTLRTHQTSDRTSFTQYCYINWPGGSAAADRNGTVDDLFVSRVYSFEECMESCIKYNMEADAAKGPCRAVTYNSNLTLIFEVVGSRGNCWLKNKRGMDVRIDDGTSSAAITGS